MKFLQKYEDFEKLNENLSIFNNILKKLKKLFNNNNNNNISKIELINILNSYELHIS